MWYLTTDLNKYFTNSISFTSTCQFHLPSIIWVLLIYPHPALNHLSFPSEVLDDGCRKNFTYNPFARKTLVITFHYAIIFVRLASVIFSSCRINPFFFFYICTFFFLTLMSFGLHMHEVIILTDL